MPDDDNPDVIPYEKIQDNDWGRTVASWQWEVTGIDEWTISGICPTCRHGTRTVRDAFIPLYKARRTGTPTLPATTRVRCECGVAHPPQPARLGCGRYATVKFKDNIKS